MNHFITISLVIAMFLVERQSCSESQNYGKNYYESQFVPPTKMDNMLQFLAQSQGLREEDLFEQLKAKFAKNEVQGSPSMGKPCTVEVLKPEYISGHCSSIGTMNGCRTESMFDVYNKECL